MTSVSLLQNDRRKKQCLYSFQAHDKYTKLFAYCATFYKFAMTEIPLFFTYLWIHILTMWNILLVLTNHLKVCLGHWCKNQNMRTWSFQIPWKKEIIYQKLKIPTFKILSINLKSWSQAWTWSVIFALCCSNINCNTTKMTHPY